jgi:positive regulator of sigma E activity
MYVIPLILLVLIGIIAVAWTPIFAVIFFVIFLVGFFAYVGMSRRADEKIAPPQQPGQTGATPDDENTGMWGERRPQE